MVLANSLVVPLYPFSILLTLLFSSSPSILLKILTMLSNNASQNSILDNDFSNLHAMDMDLTVEHVDMGGYDKMDSSFSELADAIFGIDESVSFATC